MKRVESLPPAVLPASPFPAPATPDDTTGPDFEDVFAAQKASSAPAEPSEPARRPSAGPQGPSGASDIQSPRSAHSATGATPYEERPDRVPRSVAGNGEAAAHLTGKPSRPKRLTESSAEDGSADAEVADEDTPSPNHLLGAPALALWVSDKVLGAVAPPSSGAAALGRLQSHLTAEPQEAPTPIRATTIREWISVRSLTVAAPAENPGSKPTVTDLPDLRNLSRVSAPDATGVPGGEGVTHSSGKATEPDTALVPSLMAENEAPVAAKMPTAAVLAKGSGQSSPVPVPLAPEPQNPDRQGAGKPSAAPATPPGEPSAADRPDSAAALRASGLAAAINFESLRARARDRLAPSSPDDGARPSTSFVHPGAPESRRVEAEAPPAAPAGTAETSARLARRFSEGAFQGDGVPPGEKTPEPSGPESAMLWDRSPNMVRDGRAESPSSADPASARPLSLELIQELAQRTRTLIQSGGRSEIRLALYPEHLGEVHLRALLDGRHISASILTESPAARDFLERHVTFLQHTLAEQGLDVGRIEVRQTDSFSSALSGDGRSSAQHEAPPRPPSPSSDRSDSRSWGPAAAPDAAAPAPLMGGSGIINLLV